MEILGRKEQPRFLAIGLDEGEELGQHLSNLVPTVRFVGADEADTAVRQGDYDAAVVVGSAPSLEEHLYVIQFGGTAGDTIARGFCEGTLWRSELSLSQEVQIPQGLPPAVDRLVRNELAPVAIDATEVTTISLVLYRTGGPVGGHPTTESVLNPMLSDGDGKVIAGWHARSEDSLVEWWSLPEGTPNPERWIAAALSVWAETNSEAFPTGPPWQARPEWLSVAELAIEAEREAVEAEWSEAQQRHADRLAGIDQQRAEERKIADEGERRLLTAQGGELVEEVMLALTDLGFDVVDVDEEVAEKGDLVEDLRITDRSAENWIALAEVRGYSRGAKVNDLMRIGRFVSRFAVAEGRLPTASWYVVNQFAGKDPSTRRPPLESNPEEVATFGEEGGLVIDTAVLFELRRKVNGGTMEPEEGRRLMRDARGVLYLN